MIGGMPFDETYRKRYAHVNSASFYDEMLKRTENKEAFELQHQMAREQNYGWFSEWYQAEDNYYMMMHQRALAVIAHRKRMEAMNEEPRRDS
jgi:hypothetical protein